MRRRSGGRLRPGSDTVRPPTRIVPASGSIKPATSRKVVVLPQPDGPSRQTSVPWAIVRVRPSRAAASPKCLVSDSSSTTAITLGQANSPPDVCSSAREDKRRQVTAKALFRDRVAQGGSGPLTRFGGRQPPPFQPPDLGRQIAIRHAFEEGIEAAVFLDRADRVGAEAQPHDREKRRPRC